MRDIIDNNEDFEAQLLAIDPHEKWAAKYLLKNVGQSENALTYPLLIDPSLTVSATYGVAFQMRIHVEESNRPATFIIDREGILRYARRAATYSDRPTPKEIEAELGKLK